VQKEKRERGEKRKKEEDRPACVRVAGIKKKKKETKKKSEE
jgi:hypothetical protein